MVVAPLVCCLVASVVLAAIGVGAAQPTASGGGIDGFEDGNLSEYDPAVSGENTTWSVTATDAIEGEYSGIVSMDGTPNSSAVISSSLPAPDRGETVSVELNASADVTEAAVAYAMQNATDYYYAYVSPNADEFGVRRLSTVRGGTVVAFDDSMHIHAGEVYRIQVTWQRDGDHVASLYNESDGLVTVINGHDATFTDGGVGLHASSHRRSDGGSVRFDNVTFTSPPHRQSLVDWPVDERVGGTNDPTLVHDDDTGRLQIGTSTVTPDLRRAARSDPTSWETVKTDVFGESLSDAI